MKTIVLGAGSWGTAFSRHLANCGHQVLLWGRREEFMDKLANRRENEEYLSGVRIPEEVEFTSDLRSLEKEGEAVFIAVPSAALARLMGRVNDTLSAERIEEITWVSLTKGLKFGKGDLILTMSDVVENALGSEATVLALSGPSHAEEVAKGIFTTVVLAGQRGSSSYKQARSLSKEISNSEFRVYTRGGLREVEICGGVKNPVAIGAGIARGLGKYGDNTLASLVSRGTKEIADFLDALGLRREPAFGLAGNGDLIATCNSRFSRNQKYGLAIGKGEQVQPGRIDGMVVEGYYTVTEIEQIKQGLDLEMPICEQVYQVVHNDKDPELATSELMNRAYKEEVLF